MIFNELLVSNNFVHSGCRFSVVFVIDFDICRILQKVDISYLNVARSYAAAFFNISDEFVTTGWDDEVDTIVEYDF